MSGMTVASTTGRHLHAVLARAQVEGRLPSVSAGVVRHGQLVWSGGHGVHVDAERSLRAGPDTAYRIGSITKTMTAVMVIRLRDEGVVDLSDAVGRHVREAPYPEVTLRELLSHSGGLPAEPDGPWWERHEGGDWPALRDAHVSRPAVLPRGLAHHYSNLGYGILGELVARLRERPWWDCVCEELLTPLGMTRTTLAATAPHADGYSVHPWTGGLIAEPHTDTGAMAPAGQVWSTVTDLGRWAAFLAAGRDGVLSGASLTEMARPQVSAVASGAGSGGYGLGLRLLDRGGRRLCGHTGSMPGFLAALFVDSERRTGAAVLANATLGMATEELAPALVEELETHEPHVNPPWRPPAPPPDWLAEALGVWHWGASPLELRWLGDAVTLRRRGAPDDFSAYAVLGEDRLVGTSGYHHGETMTVHRRPDGRVSHLECSTFVLTREPYDPEVNPA